MIDLFFLLIIKLVLHKIFFNMSIKIDSIHIFSTLISVFLYFIYYFFSIQNLEFFMLVTLVFLTGSYILINIPGAYVTSLRIRILKILYENGNINKEKFFLKFNDEILFIDRFERIKRHKIIKKINFKYFLVSRKILCLILFVNIMRKIYKFLNKY